MPSRKTMFTAGGVVAALVIIFVIAMYLHKGGSPTLLLEPKPVTNIGAFELPKAPHWDESRKCLFFVEVYNSTIHKYVPSTGTHTWASVGTEPMAFIIPINGTDDKFIVSLGSDLVIVTWDGKSTQADHKLWTPIGRDVYRANEGKVSPSGSLFVAGHSPFETDDKVIPNRAALYAFNKDTKASKIILSNVTVGNGMAWSKNGTVFYFIDSLAYTVSSFAYNKIDDTLTKGSVLINFKESAIDGVPDGMAIDNDDKLWITAFRGAKIIHFDPESRKILEEIKLDAWLITSVAFGGPTLKDFYVTTGKYKMNTSQLASYPNSGYLFEQKIFPFAGRASIPFVSSVV